MLVLVINSGSSSIKFRLVNVIQEPGGALKVQPALLQGAIKGIGGAATFGVTGQKLAGPTECEVQDHEQAMRVLFDRLSGSLGNLDAVGHRVVHGGDRYVEATLLTEQVVAGIDGLSELAPLHNPACLAGIKAARAVLGRSIPMVAIFDTSFHRTMPEVAKRYALPGELVDRHRIRRYGFHGIAHASLADGYARHSGTQLDRLRLITLQLGNGCSITAIAKGRSIDTSMGFTPLEGLVMGTRSGDVDPSIVSYLCEQENVTPGEVERWLNEQSGLLGVSGRSNDMKDLLSAMKEGNRLAELAVDLFCYRAQKYLGAYLAVLGGADAVVFGGGIGENAPEIRARVCANMGWCGLTLDSDRNEAAVGLPPGSAAMISSDSSLPAVCVVAADEESWIAMETARCVRSSGF